MDPSNYKIVVLPSEQNFPLFQKGSISLQMFISEDPDKLSKNELI